MKSFTRLFSFFILIGLLNQNSITIPSKETSNLHSFVERKLAVVGEILIGITFFAIGYIAGRIRGRKRNNNVNLQQEVINKRLEKTLQGRVINFYGRTYAKDVKNRCYVVIMRNLDKYDMNFGSNLKEMCIMWSEFILDRFYIYRNILDVGNALVLFKESVIEKNALKNTDLGKSSNFESIKDIFFSLLGSEIVRSLNINEINSTENVENKSIKSIKDDEESLKQTDLEISSINNDIEKEYLINKSSSDSDEKPLIQDLEKEQDLIYKSQEIPVDNKILIDNVNSKKNIEDNENLLEENSYNNEEDMNILGNYDAILNFKLMNDFYLNFFETYLGEILNEKLEFKKYKAS